MSTGTAKLEGVTVMVVKVVMVVTVRAEEALGSQHYDPVLYLSLQAPLTIGHLSSRQV